MQRLAATLVADGSSDRVLLPIIQFVLDQYSTKPFVTQHAEGLPSGPLVKRIELALQLYPCDLLFVHRDAENASVADREQEIDEGTAQLPQHVHAVKVIPVRMTEAWLLLDEGAIRSAAGNPRGDQPLGIPLAKKLESVDAKRHLFEALEAAADLGARRRRRFDPHQARHRVSELVEDYWTLRQLPSFVHFEKQVCEFFAPPNGKPR